MRRVNRGAYPAPASLTDPNGAGQLELAAARAHYAVPPPAGKKRNSYKFKAYKGHDVRVALRALFHGKCAYCETVYEAGQGGDVEHYRPKGGVTDSPAHPGYWWLAMRWDNLLPSCVDCNRRRGQTTATPGVTLAELEDAFENARVRISGKANAFPTANGVWVQPEMDPDGVEHPLLIDPTRMDPDQHLEWVLDRELSTVVPKVSPGGDPSPLGTASIHCYGLDRFGLVQVRTRFLLGLRVQAERIREAQENAENPEIGVVDRARWADFAARLIEDLNRLTAPNEPYSALTRVFLDRFQAELLTDAVQPVPEGVVVY